MKHHPFLCMALTNLVVTQVRVDPHQCRHHPLHRSSCCREASVVNAKFPAACGMRFTTAMRIHDLVLGLLAQAAPGLAPVGGSGAVVITYISTSELGETGRVVVANPVSGGSGGSATQDGISGPNYRGVPAQRAGGGAGV